MELDSSFLLGSSTQSTTRSVKAEWKIRSLNPFGGMRHLTEATFADSSSSLPQRTTTSLIPFSVLVGSFWFSSVLGRTSTDSRIGFLQRSQHLTSPRLVIQLNELEFRYRKFSILYLSSSVISLKQSFLYTFNFQLEN